MKFGIQESGARRKLKTKDNFTQIKRSPRRGRRWKVEVFSDQD
jgi:hypothetical protein